MQINLNQVSPSVSMVLELPNNQIQQSRPKVVSHKILHNNQRVFRLFLPKDGLVLSMMKQMKEEQDRQQHQQKLMAVKRKRRLIDEYDCPQPAQDYFNKHPKVHIDYIRQLDGLFHDMLEMNHILKYRQESYSNLSSVRSFKSSVDEEKKNQLMTSLNTPRLRIIEYLRHKEMTEKPQNTDQGEDEANQSMVSQVTQSNLPNTLKFISLDTSMMTKGEDSQMVSQITTRLPSPQKSPILAKLPLEVKVKGKQPQNSWKYGFNYEDRRVQYTKDFEGLVKHITTDSKINLIVHNLQVKQNLFSKALSKKIHKL